MPTIAEVRAQYPQYQDMSDSDLASALHSKFYSDIPVDEFNKRIGLGSDVGQAKQPDQSPKDGYGMAGGIADAAVQGIPIVGPLLQKAGAAATAAIDPILGRSPDTTFGQRYDEYLSRLQKKTDQFSSENPVTATAANIGGAVAATLPLAMTGPGSMLLGMVGKTLPRQAIAGAASGAAIGGADSALRGGDATYGAGVGGIIGAAAPVAGRLIGKAVSGVKNAISPEANVAADLGRAISRDNTTPEALMQRVQELSQIRPGVATLADAGGENIRGLVERVAQTPGAGRTQVIPALTGRQQGQAMRLASDLRGLTGTSKTAFQAINETAESQSKAASPLYKAAYEAGDKEIWTPGLEQLSSSPSVQAAMRSAARSWRESAIADGYGAMNPGASVKNGLLRTSNSSAPVFPNLQFWDYTKRALDDQASNAIRSGQKQKARTLTALTKLLRDELDAQVPQFSEARNAWAGPAKFMDAIEEGRNLLSNTVGPEEFAATINGMGQSEREAARIGAVSSIVAKMGNDPAKLADMTKYLRSPNVRAKIAAIMPDEASAKKWAQRLEFEVSSSELTGRSMGNSATARRIAEQRDAENIVGDLVMEAMTGGSATSLLRRVVTAGPKWLRDTLRSKADSQLAKLLVDPASSNELTGILNSVASSEKNSRALNSRITAGVRGAAAPLTAQ